MSRAALARSLRDAVVRVPGVTRLAPGGTVEVSTQFAGGKVPGVRISGPTVEVHIAIGRLPVRQVADEVHEVAAQALRDAGDERPVRVVITDIDTESLPRDLRE